MLQIGLDSQAVTNWLLVVITAVYCFLTFKIVQKNGEMVAQMRAQYDSFVAPIITTTLKIKYGTILYLLIRNKGQSAAKNVRLNLDRDFHQIGNEAAGSNIRNFPLFQRTIPSFAPDEEFFVLLCQGFNLGKKDKTGKLLTPHEFEIEVRYEALGRKVTQRHEIDLNTYMQSEQDRSEILDELEKIRKVLEHRWQA
jgi:hypothetical protein